MAPGREWHQHEGPIGKGVTIEYELHYRDGFFEIETHGGAEAWKFGEFLARMLADERWKPGTPFLTNHTDLDAGSLTVNEVRQIAAYCIDSRANFGHARCAVVVGRDLEFGLSRMWGVFVEGEWDVAAGVFRSRDEAVAWLKEDESG